MAHSFKVPTVDDLMRKALEALRSDGIHINPTKGGCREISAVAFELTNPRARASRSCTRGRLFSALGELCWYLAGSNQTDDIAYYVRFYRKFDEGGVIFGGYGPRLVSFDGVNQLEYVIGLLRNNPSSRRVVIQLFDHRDSLDHHLDIPCTCTLQYLLREGRLSAITYMRSNDVFRGMPHDIFCFTMLQEIIARSIGAELGSYHHMVGSLHLYDRDVETLDAFLAEGWQSTARSMPDMPVGDPWLGVESLLRAEENLRAGRSPSEVDFGPQPYWADLGRLLGIYAVLRNDGPREAIDLLHSAMSSGYYNCYVTDRADTL
jgi:thymidylate synthase